MNKKYSRGVTLVEILVAMVIGLTLMGGVTLIMISSQRTYTVQGDMARLQENSRFALDFLTRDLRSVGYFGCAGGQPAGTVAIGSFDGNSREGDGPNQSDSLDISFLETGPAAFAVVDPNPADDVPLQFNATSFTATNPGAMNVNSEVMASDCGGASRLYQVTSVNGNAITINQGLDRNYNNRGQLAGAEMRRLAKYRYRIAPVDIDGNIVGTDGAYTFSLVRDIIGPAPGFNVLATQELVQGVETLQIRYGEDLSGDGIPDQYRTFDNVTSFANVSSVRVGILMRTINNRSNANLDLNTNTYVLEPGQPAYDPEDDYRLRRVFSTLVFLRNNNI
ncbi:MAG: PilW family protein [Pseudomonadota bacterium]